MKGILAIFVAQVCCYGGPIIYVDKDATGCNNGTSWINAYRYLQDALADANAVEKPIEIRVAQGIYRPDRRSDEPNGTGHRTATFQLINGVTIKGGYAGFGAPDPNARDISRYETVLSGDLAGNDIDFIDPRDLLNEQTRSENSFHVVTGSGTDATAVLDGFTITGGNARADLWPTGDGGGMYSNTGSPVINECTFVHNSARRSGGGMTSYHSRAKIVNCKFVGNCASAGGGMYNVTFSQPEVVGCTFIRNRAERGGGICNDYHTSTVLLATTFSDNWADVTGGGMQNISDSDARLSNCEFSQNFAGQAGGGMANYGSSPVLSDCSFRSNSARIEGGAMYNGPGSGRGPTDSRPSLANCLFNDNSAARGGGVFTCVWSKTTLTNCTFAGNLADKGSALACDSTADKRPSTIRVANCVVWNSECEIWNNDGSAISIDFSDVRGGRIAVHDPCDAVTWGNGNVDADPLFADPNSSDFHLKSQGGRWDPKIRNWVKDDVTSPYIDAGDPASPIGYEPFPNGGIINMGA
ncbi:MAG: hypothetical protein NTX52_09240, partial [Planctomycetota bacterium]|nr:hypothetical protein [Planctomycetota bacterium]